MSVRALTQEALAERPLPEPPADGDKHDRGTVLVVAGGGALPGAAILTGKGALRVGAGRIRLAAVPEVCVGLGLMLPEARILRVPATADGEIGRAAAEALIEPGADCDAIVVGPGMMDPATAGDVLRRLLSTNRQAGLVADAAALPRASEGPSFASLAEGRVVLTPHAGEMARMMDANADAVAADALGFARRAADTFRSFVVMKGATTFVASPSGAAWRHDGGVAGLATAGSGDVLAGVIGGLLARGAEPEQAAIWGVHLHAAAGRRLAERCAPLGFMASDLLDLLPRLLPRLKGAGCG